MKNSKLLPVILLSSMLLCFNCSKKNDHAWFSFDESAVKKHYNGDESINLRILNPENKEIDSIVYYSNDKKLAAVKGAQPHTYALAQQRLGYQNLKADVYFDGEALPEQVTLRTELVSKVQPKLLPYTIVNSYPHQTSSFTQGLEFYNDTLIESTGLRGSSRLLKTDYKTGKILKELAIGAQYFGEGITIINNRIFQLTWQENTGFIYNADTWKPEKTYTYDKKIEGWGLANDGRYIYQSDGTEKIWKMEPDTQKLLDHINVYTASTKIKQVNELEWINGKLYGNIWQKDALAVIDPATGSVEAIVDLSALRKLVRNNTAEALNGIAYNPKTKTIFVTGKNWDTMFEIRVNDTAL